MVNMIVRFQLLFARARDTKWKIHLDKKARTLWERIYIYIHCKQTQISRPSDAAVDKWHFDPNHEIEAVGLAKRSVDAIDLALFKRVVTSSKSGL